MEMLAGLGPEERYFKISVIASVVFHLAFTYYLFFNSWGGVASKAVIYSVTVEGGATRGGVTQIPDKNNKSAIVPMKKVSQEPSKKQEAKPEEKVKPEKKEEKPEVVIPEKKAPVVKPEEKKVETAKKEEVKTGQSTGKDVKKAPTKPALPDANQNYQKAMQRYLGESTAAGGHGFGAAGGVGRGMGGGIVKSPEWFRYKALLEAHIKEGWVWHDNRANLKALIRFKISPTGVLSDISLSQASGNLAYDDSVYRAVNRASPVPAAPPSVYPDFKDVEIEFVPE